MPQITINGATYPFEKGKTILQVAIDNGIEIPHYCYHPSLSIPANCRICLAEISQPNPRTGAMETIPKLMPTCHTAAADGMVVTTESAKAVENQKAVMEFLLINHPVDCPVCDQAGECHLQDYSYEYGRSASRFVELKIKQPKKDVGPGVLLYSDRCIMCTRCVRFTREVTQTGELMVDGRGGTESIDVFPGMALDNELAGNVVDLCPVGALLDKEFLFQQRVWFMESAASVDGITASGDNIWVDHADGRVWRVRPRENAAVNQWWITDEVRHGWRFVHHEERLTMPALRGATPWAQAEAGAAWRDSLSAADGLLKRGRVALLVSPMLTCEDAYLLAHMALAHDPKAILGVGPVRSEGKDKSFPNGFTVRAEKAPNARGVRRVLEAVAAGFPGRTGPVLDAQAWAAAVAGEREITCLVTGNYPGDIGEDGLRAALAGKRLILLDTLPSPLTGSADVFLPAATWLEKRGSFENDRGLVQGFQRAITPLEFARAEGEVAIALDALRRGVLSPAFDADALRREMGATKGLEAFAKPIDPVGTLTHAAPAMKLVEL